MDSFLENAGKLLGALNFLNLPLHSHAGSSPALELERNQWLESSTRESILVDFTKFLLNGEPGRRAVFISAETATLKNIFSAHANPDNCWDRLSLESYLLTQMLDDEACKALLTSCSHFLWALVTHFAQWPFTTTPSGTLGLTSLTFPAYVRALAFLSGRHSIIFRSWRPEDEVPARKDRLVLEQIFQAITTTRPVGQASDSSPPGPVEPTAASWQRDILDVLKTTQPVLNEFTDLINRDELTPLAVRLTAPAPRGLSSSSISPNEDLVPFLDLSILFLQHASKFDTTGTPVLLIKDLDTARTKLQHVKWISYDTFKKQLGDDDLNIYDAIALPFNTFLNPNSLRGGNMVDRTTGQKMDLLLYALRRPGLTLISN